MPTTVYDSSLITALKRSKVESYSFITRQSGPNPTTSYGPTLGIWDQSIINVVKIGQMYEVKKVEGCIQYVGGCPGCAIVSDINTSNLNVYPVSGQ